MTTQPLNTTTTFPERTLLGSFGRSARSRLSPADASEIRETVARVFLAEDTRDADAFAELLTADFRQKHSLYGELESRAAFVEWLQANPQAFDRFRHMALNTVTKKTGEGSAEALSYLLVLEVHPAPGADARPLPRVLAHGVVRDRLQRTTDGRWQIEERIYDQFAIAAALVEDESVRQTASKRLA